MKTAQEILSRIRWDNNLANDEFVVGYFDRLEHEIIRVAFKEIHFPQDDHFSFEVVDEDENIHSIPYHRVKEIFQNGELIWHRDN